VSIEPQVQAALIKGKDQLFAQHGQDRNFTGCGVGFRRRGGQVTDEPVIIAMVEHKLPAGAVSSRYQIPATVEVDGVSYGVDVVEAGPIFAASGQSPARPDAISTSGPITGQYLPPVPGCSIANVNATPPEAGTLGCFVTDNTDSTVCVLSANHVIARINEAPVGESIIQPGEEDGGDSDNAIATVKRFVTLADAPALNPVDVAIAELNSQPYWSPEPANGLMEPISETHPAVGMCVARDSSGNSFLTQMNLTLSAINATIAGASASSPWVVAPVVGTNIEKVGRTSGYTSSVIDAISVVANVDYGGTVLVMSDLIWSQFLSIGPGDSGAVACVGGSGDVFALPPAVGCEILASVEAYFGIPTSTANALTNRIQGQFLSQSLSGNLAINLVYMNSKVVLDRLAADTGDAYNQATAQAYAQEYYAKYYDVIVNALANPDSTDSVITNAMIEDYYTFWEFMTMSPADGGAGGIISTNEADAAYAFMVLIGGCIGMDYQQFSAFLDEAATYNYLYQLTESTGTLEVP
jgi:hypothetical protein